MIQRLTIELLDNEKGRQWLQLLHNNLWHETPTNVNNTSEYVWIDGKRTFLRDIENLLNSKKEDIL